MACKQSKSSTTSSKPGRPRWKPADLEKVKQLAGQGLTRDQIAHNLGIGRTTLFRTMIDDADFANAIKEGESAGIAAVTNALYQSALNGNTTAQIFYLKCRAGWNDKVDPPLVQQNIHASGNVVIESKLDEAAQIRAAAAFCRSKGLEVIGD